MLTQISSMRCCPRNGKPLMEACAVSSPPSSRFPNCKRNALSSAACLPLRPMRALHFAAAAHRLYAPLQQGAAEVPATAAPYNSRSSASGQPPRWQSNTSRTAPASVALALRPAAGPSRAAAVKAAAGTSSRGPPPAESGAELSAGSVSAASGESSLPSQPSRHSSTADAASVAAAGAAAAAVATVKKRTRRVKADAALEADSGAAHTAAAAAAATAKPNRSRRPRKTTTSTTTAVAEAGAAAASDAESPSDGEAGPTPAAKPSRGSRRRSAAATYPASTSASGSAAAPASAAPAAASAPASARGLSRAAALQGESGGGAGSGEGCAAGVCGQQVVFSCKVPRGAQWLAVGQWVVFSDLHVRESSLATCLEVLREVEAQASRRQAGIMFLGDFWDKRGVLPVEPLNQVLQVMSQWRCPVVMLVGNHDQVDLGGLQHGLTPLELACPHVHVFDEPTIWNGALWLPYRRESWVLEQAMAQAVQQQQRQQQGGGGGGGGGERKNGGQGSEAPPVKAIFLHADVRTARTNQWRQAEEGLEPGAFPPDLPVYSGHYHLPHTVRNTNITYVGSPYQVSMNEASEAKRLLVLEAATWRVVEELPLSIGPRHIRLSGTQACDQLRRLAAAAASSLDSVGSDASHEGLALAEDAAEGGEEGGGGVEGRGGAAGAAGASMLRSGDRLKLWLSAAEAEDEEVVRAMAELERAGVAVEQVLQPQARAPRVQAAEGLSAEQLVELYCAAAGGLSEAAAAAVREAVAAAREAAGSGGEGSAGRCVELELESVRLRGFGPFVEEQTYPLAGRGVRVISGENLDEQGADSNGAGKTSLVTAPLWALTGEVLTRTESGGGGRVPVDSMRNDRCGSCSVVLAGRVNGEAFEVEREVKRGKTSLLRFSLGGEDLTLQDINSTADRIRRHFSTELLRCSAFFGQNDITGLLEANDATLKQKLGLVVDLEIWEAARQQLVAPRKAAAAAAAGAEGRVKLLQEQVERRGAEVEALRREERQWAEGQAERLAKQEEAVREAAAQGLAAAAELGPVAAAARAAAAQLREAAAAAEEEQRRWEEELTAERARRQADAAAAGPPSAHSPSAAAASPVSAPLPGDCESSSLHSGASGDEQQQQQQQQAEEEAAQRLLCDRQQQAAALRTQLGERQQAASQALGQLRQLQASLREYVAAVSQLMVAAAAVGPGNAAAEVAVGRAARAAAEGGALLLGRRSPIPAPSSSPHASPIPGPLPNASGASGDRDGSDSSGGGRSSSGSSGSTSRGYESSGSVDLDIGNGAGNRGLLQLQPQSQTDLAVEVAGAGVGAEEGGGSGAGSAVHAVCDRCRQPISQRQYRSNVARLESGIAGAQQAYDEAAAELRQAQQAVSAAEVLVSEADAAATALVRRRIEAESRAAAEARAAAAAAERQARVAAEAARQAQEAAWREAERALQGLQARMAESSRLRGELVTAATSLERTAADLDHAAAAWSVHADAVLRDAGAALALAPGPVPPSPFLPSPSSGFSGSADEGAAGAAGATLVPRGIERAAEATGGGLHGPAGGVPGGAAAAAVSVCTATPAALLASSEAVLAEGRRVAQAVARGLAGWQAAAQAAAALRREVNPATALRTRAEQELQELERQRQAAEAAGAAADANLRALTDADKALGRTGIPSLVLEDVLAQLQTYTSRYLEQLCGDFVLELSATRPAGGSSSSGGAGGARGGAKERERAEKEEIHKVIKVRSPADGSLRQRDVRQLSGGERRRVALALCLGFEALVRSRRRLVCNLIVLDEVLQQLDNTGCELVAGVLRDLPHASVLVVGQTNSSVTANFDMLDVVVKEGGASHMRMVG